MATAERRRFPRIPGIGSLVEVHTDVGVGEARLLDLSSGGLSMDFVRPYVTLGDVIKLSLMAADHEPLILEGRVVRVVDEVVGVEFVGASAPQQRRLDATAALPAELG